MENRKLPLRQRIRLMAVRIGIITGKPIIVENKDMTWVDDENHYGRYRVPAQYATEETRQQGANDS